MATKGKKLLFPLVVSAYLLFLSLLIWSLGGIHSAKSTTIDIPLHDTYLVLPKWELTLSVAILGLTFVLVFGWLAYSKFEISWRSLGILVLVWALLTFALLIYADFFTQTNYNGWEFQPPGIGYYSENEIQPSYFWLSFLKWGIGLVDALFLLAIAGLVFLKLPKTKLRNPN